jgi:short chain dehydrogenase
MPANDRQSLRRARADDHGLRAGPPEAAAVLPGMLDAGWGRIVNVSSAIVAEPASMVRFNTYAATKAALEAHTVNLAADVKRFAAEDRPRARSRGWLRRSCTPI